MARDSALFNADAFGLMAGRARALRLVIFDCDGVIVDSEPVVSRLVAEALTIQGWEMTGEEAQDRFLGMTLTDMMRIVEARLDRALPEGWKQDLTGRIITAMRSEVAPIPGAVEALRATSELGVPWRIASNSSHVEMQTKFACLGITDLVTGRVHSHNDVPRGKPAPDLFLATAAAERVDPVECLVIEDSLPGARAAAAAGMDCLGYAPHSDGSALRGAGAVPFASMFDLPGLIHAATRRVA